MRSGIYVGSEYSFRRPTAFLPFSLLASLAVSVDESIDLSHSIIDLASFHQVRRSCARRDGGQVRE